MLDKIPKDLFQLSQEVKIPEKVTSEEDYKKASDSVSFVRRRLNYIEDKRKELTKPLFDQQKAINNVFKQATKPLENTMALIEGKMLAWHKAQQEKQKLLEDEALANAKAGEVVIVDDVASAKIKSEFSTASVRTMTKYRIKPPFDSFIEIKVKALQEYLTKNPLPDFIEEYEEQDVVIRSK
jgi:hypothetical protein